VLLADAVKAARYAALDEGKEAFHVLRVNVTFNSSDDSVAAVCGQARERSALLSGTAY
jgi:hypothetical protein